MSCNSLLADYLAVVSANSFHGVKIKEAIVGISGVVIPFRLSVSNVNTMECFSISYQLQHL